MKIRALLESDAEAWWHLRLASLENEPLAFGKSADEHRELSVEAIALRFRDAPAGDVHLGAFDDERLVGMAAFIRETGVKENHKGHIYGVYVDATQRRKGVGQALLADLLQRATRDPSLEQILLSVGTAQSAAKRLYRSLGFETYGTERDALKVGSCYVDEDHMVLRIAPRTRR